VVRVTRSGFQRRGVNKARSRHKPNPGCVMWGMLKVEPKIEKGPGVRLCYRVTWVALRWKAHKGEARDATRTKMGERVERVWADL